MDSAINILWTVLLIVIVLVVPYLVYLLHSTWRAARGIERYFNEMKQAGLGIAANTEHIGALNNTITVASGILGVEANINEHAGTIKDTLGGRAAQLN